MITEQDKKQIAQWEIKNQDIHQLTIAISPDQRSGSIEMFATELSDITAYICAEPQKIEDGFGYIEIDGRLKYHAIPQNRELSHFLEALAYSKKPPKLSDRILRAVEGIKVPSSLMLFITPQCPHCPVLVRQMIPIVFSTPLLKLTVVDGVLFPEMAKTYDVKSVPSLFLDDDFQWNGMVSIDELLNTIVQRDPAQLSITSLKNLLKEGKAALLADMMVHYGRIFPAFFSLLTHEKWPVRLGAMVTFEEIVHQNKNIARSAVAPLLDQFEKMDDQVKGDVIYLFGLLKDVDIVPFFKKIEKGPYDDEIREAAAEALGNLGIKNS